jgi:hypothetical protein
MGISEISYDKEAGVHKIEADYSLTSYSKNGLESIITAYNGKVISNERSVVEFDISRDAIINFFKNEIDRSRKVIYRRQYYFDERIVDEALKNGGVIKLSEKEFTGALRDKAHDSALLPGDELSKAL